MEKVKNAVLFYFSGTGNTRYMANAIATALPAATVYSIEDHDPSAADDLIAGSDLVGFGYPIYGSDLPKPMKDFLSALSPIPGKPVFVFCTQWIFSGDGARAAKHYLKHTGFDIRWAEHFLMPNNVCVSIMRYFFIYTNEPTRIQPVLKKATDRARVFAGRILSGKKSLRGFNPFSHFLGLFQRVPFRASFERWRNDIAIDPVKCTRCGLCVRKCPSSNLEYDEKTDEFLTHGTCILCLRCYDFCPVSAVTYMKRPHDVRRGEPYKGPSGRLES
jgi:ferredoxin/flavodoxin